MEGGNKDGIMGGLSDLMKNKLFLQYLSSAGSALSGGENIAGALNNVTQQQIGAQSMAGLNNRYMDMFRNMLAGNMPEGSKWSSDEKGTKVEFPRNLLNEKNEGEGDDSKLKQITNESSKSSTRGLAGNNYGEITNPFPTGQLANIPANALAGLSAKDVANALGGVTNVANLQRQSINDVTNRAYKQAMIDKMSAPQAQSPVMLKGTSLGDINQEIFKELPTSSQEFLLYEASEKARGNEPMSLAEYESVKDNPETMKGAALRQAFIDNGYKIPSEKELVRLNKAFDTSGDSGPGEVSWTTATNNLTKRFGELDPTGQWVITPELQSTHRKAQEFLVDMKDEELEPLDAINKAESKALKWKNKIERNYFNYIDKYRNNEEMVDSITSKFQEKYGYVPSRRF